MYSAGGHRASRGEKTTALKQVVSDVNEMTAASYKFDDGQRNRTKCVPGRRKEVGAGHWLVAYERAERQQHKKHRRLREKYRRCDSPQDATLDGPLLLRLHCVDTPSELCSVDISEQRLNSVKPEDLQMFDNVAYVDASINSLSLGSFRSFVSLRELNLALNGLHNMMFHAADFPLLEVLDLSYNSLSADDIVSVGRLPRLRVLHLTGNQLHHLPPHLGSSSPDASQLSTEEDTPFRALQVLMLDNNKLSSAVFHSLRDLQRLQYLNLQGNCISGIPYLQPTGASDSLSAEDRDEEEASAEPNPISNDHAKIPSQEHIDESCRGHSAPLPQLRSLNLADNRIVEEEALMAAALFPMLREIDIHSNPVCTRRSGDPPLLTYYLRDRLGITIKRKKTQEVPLKLPLKEQERIPKVSKKRLLMDAPCPVRAEKSKATVRRRQDPEGQRSRDDSLHENTQHFFVTQATDFPEFLLKTEEEETAENKETTRDDEEFRCYELLMDAKPNPDVAAPIGIQTAVRMLEHTLRNLNVYRDLKPNLDCIQKHPYRAREKKIEGVPAVTPVRQMTDRLDDMIKEMKVTTTMRHVPLSSAMHGSGANKQEALSLLKDMKAKYKMVHERTMELAASMETERSTDTNRAETVQKHRLQCVTKL